MTVEVHLRMACSYTNELIRSVLEEEDNVFRLIDSSTSNHAGTLLWLEYEDLDFDLLYRLARGSSPTKVLANSYCIRKGLLRKANFALFIQKYLSKKPDSPLRTRYPDTHILDLPHPDYLDEALNEAFELRDAMEANVTGTDERIPFILKASILDKASELFIFHTQAELEGFFTQKFDGDEDEDDGGDETIANVREWVVQRYIQNPKLLSAYQNRKFHLRVYVVAEKNLRVYVYDGILALFASLSYEKDADSSFDRLRHITNTCAQTDSPLSEADLVKEFFTLEELDDELRSHIFEQVKIIVREIFAGLHNETTIFQPLKNAFEIYGFDFLIDDQNNVFFLEANAFPDFKQTGNSLSVLIKELFQNVVQQIVLPYFGLEQPKKDIRRQLHLVYEKLKAI